jgi:hypothetical protein
MVAAEALCAVAYLLRGDTTQVDAVVIEGALGSEDHKLSPALLRITQPQRHAAMAADERV